MPCEGRTGEAPGKQLAHAIMQATATAKQLWKVDAISEHQQLLGVG